MNSRISKLAFSRNAWPALRTTARLGVDWPSKPGRCDGYHPEYTEAFDITGLRGAAVLADAIDNSPDASNWTTTTHSLWKTYDEHFLLKQIREGCDATGVRG